MNDEFYTGQRQLRIQKPGKETLTFLCSEMDGETQ